MRIKTGFEVNILFLTYYTLKKFKILNTMRYKIKQIFMLKNILLKQLLTSLLISNADILQCHGLKNKLGMTF